MIVNRECHKSILEGINISKAFGNVEVLKDVNFNLKKGEVVALVGNNGAGKSTLIKIMSGVYTQDQGYFNIKGKKVNKLTPEQAITFGITTVYQDLSLVDTLDVSSNIFLGKEPIMRGFFIDKNKMDKEADNLINKLNIDIPSIDTEVSVLSGGQRQGVAIARAINQGGEILILDEPTAAMGVKESKEVFKLIRNLKEKGYTIVIISHNIQQVFQISDRIIVIRNGQVAGSFMTTNTSEKEIVNCITGTL